LALAAEHTIQLSTCYLNAKDPAVRYIFLNLLPYCMETRGVSVQVLVDLMVVESMVVRSAFQDSTRPNTSSGSTTHPGGVTSTSFLEHLPPGAPYFTAPPAASSSLDFLQQLTELAARSRDGKKKGHFQIEFWCARDAHHRYRIKNHAKCVVFDQHAAIIGGSNVCPTLAAATAELDLVVAGPAAAHVGASFAALWNAVATSGAALSPEETPTTSAVRAALGSLPWADACPVTILRSQPSSRGEDAILRVVLGAIHAARSSIVMCFGHSNCPPVLVDALLAATNRGVRVQMLVNSLYSCDLRGGQRDLFLSLRDLLRRAPRVEVYATTMKKPAGGVAAHGLKEEEERPNFVHAKYVTMDGHWSAVGSWNVWMRGSFYEIEHEALVESAVIAQALEEKFEFDKASTAVRLETPHQCEPGRGFCPTGCPVCRGFGPFYA